MSSGIHGGDRLRAGDRVVVQGENGAILASPLPQNSLPKGMSYCFFCEKSPESPIPRSASLGLALLGKFLLERDLGCPPPFCLGWGLGRETAALVTPDNHLWSLTVWPLPPSNSKYLLDIISPCRPGRGAQWVVRGEEGSHI